MRLLCALLAAWFAYLALGPLLAPARIEYRPAPTVASRGR